MKLLPYYDKSILKTVEVAHGCPGCGKISELAMRSKVNSYVHNKTEFYVGCNCGWMGPVAESPVIAAVKWDVREMIRSRYPSAVSKEKREE